MWQESSRVGPPEILRDPLEKFDRLGATAANGESRLNIEGLSLDQMRAALMVAESGSFSAAARRLSRKQSALSYAVATLEDQLGVVLFDRVDGQRPKPTEVGRLLLLEMEAVVRRADEIKK